MSNRAVMGRLPAGQSRRRISRPRDPNQPTEGNRLDPVKPRTVFHDVAPTAARRSVTAVLRFSASITLCSALLPPAILTASGPVEIEVSPPSIAVGEMWLLDTDPSRDALEVSVDVLVSRDQPLGEPRDIPFLIEVRLTEDLPDGVAVGSAAQQLLVDVPPVVNDMQLLVSLSVKPDRILSEEHGYILQVAVFHNADHPSGEFTQDHIVEDGPHDIAHYSGTLHFGSVETTVKAFSAAPEKLAAPGAWRIAVAEGELANGTPFSNGPPPSTPQLEIARNDSDGRASVVDGAVLVEPDDPGFSVNGWTGRLGRVSMDADGLEAVSFVLDLPEGSGWRRAEPDTEWPRTLNPVFFAAGESLVVDQDLQPSQPVAGTLPFAYEFVDERQAVGFVGTQWSWNLDSLRIATPETRFLRQWHYDQWKSFKGDLPDTNDGYFDQLLANALTDLHIRPGMDGGFSVELGLSDGEFFTHFPHGYVRHLGGVIRLENSVPDPEESGMNGAFTAVVSHTGCRAGDDPHEAPDPATREAVAVGPTTLRFTAHGSLWTEGMPLTSLQGATVPIVRRAAAGQDPDSGLPVHETANYAGQDVQILVPGALVPAAQDLPGALNPVRWLYAGVRTDEDDALEYPGTSAYLAGNGDYAGVNFRHFAGLTGTSRIGGAILGPYQLDSCQKVYARFSGVTGSWAAEAGDLPPAIEIGGPDPFLFVFDLWAFQLIGNEPQFDYGAIAGSVSLPYPADFTLAFDSIEFHCCGNLDRLSLSGENTVRSLAYWGNARIDIQSARFVSADACSMKDSCLELHVLALANGFPNDLDGILLFRGNGRMTTGLDAPHPASALHVPNGSPFMGDYRITPVRHAYYNNPPAHVGAGGSGPGDGFISVAGHLGLPFFDAMEAHAILFGMENPPTGNPDIIPGLRRGWTVAGQTFFNNTDFDAEHRGLPPEFDAWIEYTTSHDEALLTMARRTWFGKIPFNFPVLFDPPTRHFHSVEKKEIDIIIAQAEADVPRLNHRQAAIDFGITIGLSLNNLFSDVLALATGKLVGGFADLVLGSSLEDLGTGLDELDTLLSLQVRDALGDPIVSAFDGPIATAAQQLKQGADVQSALGHIDFGASVQEEIASATAVFVTGKLGPISEGLAGIRAFLAPGEENQIGEFMQVAMGFIDLPPGFDSFSIDELIELAELTDGPLRDRLDEIRNRMEELRELVENISGLGDQLEDLFTGANTDFTGLQTTVRFSLEDYFEMVHADLGAFTQAEIETRIRNEVEDLFWALPVTHEVQNVLRSRFYHFDHLIQQVVSSALDQLNRAITDIVAEAVDLDGLLNDLTGFTGYVQAISLKGEAVITGDDLTYLSLKGRTTIQTEPVPLDFHPFYEYRQLHSDGANGCDPNAQPALFNRITMGATVAPARMPVGEVSVTISSQFSFTGDGEIIGFMGGFEFLQEGLTMQPVNFDRISALLNIGADGPDFGGFEFYLAAEGNATIFANNSPIQSPWSNFKLHGGIFLGRTCTDAPYAAWAPGHVVNNLAGPPLHRGHRGRGRTLSVHRCRLPAAPQGGRRHRRLGTRRR